MDYESWNEAIVAHFFAPSMAQTPVYLSVDDDTLRVIAEEQGWSAATAVDDFQAAVRSVVHGPRPFVNPLQDAVRWRSRGSRGTPPFAAVLGATVLAASRMGPREGGGRGAYSYYWPLRQVLDLSGAGTVPSYGDVVPMLWEYLQEWLEAAGGAFGLPTARTRPNMENIGWSLSQAVLRGADRGRLAVFFRAIGAHPHEDIDGMELLLRLREWCKTAGRGGRLAEVAANAEAEWLLADMLHAELLRFDGTARDERGRLCLRVALTSQAGGEPFGLAVQVPPGAALPDVSAWGWQPQAGQWNWLPASWLLGPGLDVDRVVGPLRLLLPSRDCYLFRINDFLGAWASVDDAEAGVEHRILVRTHLADEVPAAAAATDGEAVLARRAVVPQGWVAFARFVPQRSASLPPPLAVLSPRAGRLATLQGGLRVHAHEPVYLTDGPPDVVVPAGGDAKVTVAGEEHLVDPTIEVALQLSGLELPAAAHEITVGPRKMTIRLVDRLRETAPRPMMGHAVHVTATGHGWLDPLPVDLREAASCPARWWSGAAAMSIHDLGETDPVQRALLRVGGEVHVLGSSARRECARIYPAAPRWLEDLGLPPSDVDLEPALVGVPFPVEWVVTVLARSRRVQWVGGARPAPGPAPTRAPDVLTRVRWRQLVTDEQRPATFPAGPDEEARWRAYVDGGL
ncbi:hypothetical protein Drose_01550 [Dactylosporangium roseum]|uniref:Uncharacterized protein n=1 Tax=Dactylosporangium roseum TaxID=47989 RepID=A0ABY5Z8K4_9ACTN|nr:hypothetical protein [Dactylosporangium roseum]UWZ37038.1 hypothetical protein Drose_01550 [Dactylosporangium roseum]